MTEVTVIGASLSLFCCRIEWALKLKGVAYDYIEEDLRNKSPMLLHCNPVYKKVPVLLHNGKPISESLVILEYIDEMWKGYPLFPEDPYERAMVRFWAKFIDEKCVLGAWTACHTKGQEKERAVESVLESLQLLETQIEGKKFFGGEAIGSVDLVMGSLPNWINFLEETGSVKLLDAEKFPALHEWYKKFIEIPILEGRMPTKDGLIKLLTG